MRLGKVSYSKRVNKVAGYVLLGVILVLAAIIYSKSTL